MSETNETFSSSNASESAAISSNSPIGSRVRRRILQFRPNLDRVSAVRQLTVQLLPRFLAQKLLPPEPEASDKAVETFAMLALQDHENAAHDFIAGLRTAGASAESIYLDWLAPAARHLGGLWASDTADFASVTLAVNRLHRILRDLGDAFAAERSEIACQGSALLTTIPGEQHSFGLAMVAEFFRRNGWDICVDPVETHRELRSLVHKQWFDIVGFSVSSDRRLSELRQDIADIRRESQNRDVGIMLGGPMALLYPEMLSDMGADVMSGDAATAPETARALAARLKTRLA